ncbi:hypothetical protein CJ030_MR5G009624 [Morella rubra]|uniref:Uncharacterized protein n=1 Tax=Morella rubra TaxID=262757 RepID=A0A6A1VK91_9ROSI|nr:hypothetical protein CJ030_MR5G009624 [Morella rubra]
MADYLTTLPKGLLQDIIIKATKRIPWRDPYVPQCPENMVNTLLSIHGMCKAFREASDYGVIYRSCHVEELPNLVVCPLEIAKFLNLLLVHRKLDVLFFRGILTMLVRNNYSRGLRLLGPLKENEDMGWLKDHIARQFIHESSEKWELHVTVESWLQCHGGCQLTKVPGLNPKSTVDYYDDDLCMYFRANQEMAYFVYRFTDQYLLPL